MDKKGVAHQCYGNGDGVVRCGQTLTARPATVTHRLHVWIKRSAFIFP